MPDRAKIRAVILISGSGTTMENLLERASDGSCHMECVGVISSKEGVAGIARAQKFGVPVQVVGTYSMHMPYWPGAMLNCCGLPSASWKLLIGLSPFQATIVRSAEMSG